VVAVGAAPARPTAFRPGGRTRMLAGEEVAMKYKVALHRSDEGISVSVPALPGCWSEGDTEEEALANIRDAIQEYVAALEDRLQGVEVRELEV
jgi:predicted RNase H-like HicB family nuclease